MENFKVYKKGEYVVLVNIKKNEYFYGKAKEVFFDKDNTNIASYKVFNVKDLKEDTILIIGKIFREDNTLYTESQFEEFYTGLYKDVVGGLTDTELRAAPIQVIVEGTVTPYTYISQATTNPNTISPQPSKLYVVSAIGLTSTVRYLKFYDTDMAPIVGTDTPVMTIPVPANTQGAGIVIPFNTPVNFSTGLSFAITSGSADTNTGAVLAGDVIINLTYL
jgi:hypothetical protein